MAENTLTSILNELISNAPTYEYTPPEQAGPGPKTLDVKTKQALKELANMPLFKEPVQASTLIQGTGGRGVYNTGDFSLINVDEEITNSNFRNAWNSFKRGWDESQISTAFGKFAYSPVGDSYEALLDNYPDQKDDLEDQLKKGIINAKEYGEQLSSLESAYQKAYSKKAEYERYKKENEAEIADSTISKEYLYNSMLVQASGDEASISDRLKYTMAGTIGSSASLILPQLAATFGANITRALIRSSAAYMAGPEAGLPANAIATVGAIVASAAEILYGRLQESYGEVGSTILDVRNQLYETYAREHNIDITDIPEDIQRELRIQSRKGADAQFAANMMLGVSDLAQAIVMPGSTFTTTLSKTGLGKLAGTIGTTIKEAGDYNRLTRVARTAAQTYYNVLGEKFEEGYQYAAGERAYGAALGIDKYSNKELIADILEDAYDVVSSLNYSLVPGIDIRGGGKYSDDKQFQFSENAGGMLGLFMGAIPSAISVSKDLLTYRAAVQKLGKEGVINPDDKIFRLQHSILKSYFEKDQVPYLLEAIRSLKNKRTSPVDPIVSENEYNETKNNIDEAYSIYSAISDKINGLKGDKWAFFNTKELSQARAFLKEDLFHSAMGIIKSRREFDESLRSKQAEQDKQILQNESELPLNNYKDLKTQLDVIAELTSNLESILGEDLNKIEGVGENSRESLKSRIELLKAKQNRLKESLSVEEKSLSDLGINYSDVSEPTPQFTTAIKNAAIAELNLNKYQSDYNDLLKIKTYKQAKEYVQKSNRTLSVRSPLNNEQGLESIEPVEENSDNTDQGDNIDALKETPEAVEEGSSDFFQQGVNPAHINEQVVKAFREALDDLSVVVDIAGQDITPGERLNRLQAGLQTAGVDLSKLRFEQIYGIFRENFKNQPEYIKEKFELLRGLIYSFKAPLNNLEELREIRNFELDSETLSLAGTGTTFTPPPAQTIDQSVSGNINTIRHILSNTGKEGTGLKITSGLSLATKNIVSAVNINTGQVGNYAENGRLQFTGDGDQQLINTSFVTVGTPLSVKVSRLPDGFDLANVSDENYDSVEIEVYATVHEDVPNGRVEKEVRLGYLHRIDALPRLLSESVSLSEQQNTLRQQRRRIIQSKTRRFRAVVTDKGFGFLNLNRRNLQLPLDVAFQGDNRIHISTVDGAGRARDMKNGLVYQRNIKDLIPGATVFFIPNEMNNGTIYIPMYASKQQLSQNHEILGKVVSSVSEYLKTGSRRFLSDAEKYIYITNTPKEASELGNRGIYWAYDSKTGVASIVINGKRITTANIDELRTFLGQVYFTANNKFLPNEDYQKEIIRSGLLTTNITNNAVLKERYESKEYSFLKGDQQYSYFSQHTITLGDFQEVGSNEPLTKLISEQTIDPREEISRLRAERIEKAKELGVAFEEGKGSMKALYDQVFSMVNSPEALSSSDPADIQDLENMRRFLNMYDEYEERMEKLRVDNNIAGGLTLSHKAKETYLRSKQNPDGTITLFRGIMAEGELGTGQFHTTDRKVAEYYANRASRLPGKGKIISVNVPFEIALKRFMGLEGNKGPTEGSDIFSLHEGERSDIEQQNVNTEEIENELRDIGIDIDFDDLVGSLDREFPPEHRGKLSDLLGIKSSIGARYTDSEVESVQTKLDNYNRRYGTDHKIIVIKSGSEAKNAIALSLRDRFTADDTRAVSLQSKLLVSKDISATLQNQMVDSIAYMLLSGEDPKLTRNMEREELSSNRDRVKRELSFKLSKFQQILSARSNTRILAKVKTLARNYDLLLQHYDALYEKAVAVLEGLGFEASTDSDYYENLEENIEDNNVTQFNDDSNRTRDQKSFLPSEVRKLLYFIPHLVSRDLSNPKDLQDMQDPENPYYGKTYKAKPNTLGLPSFNDFNDTLEKTLSIISERTFSSDESGFIQMLEVLQQPNNPLVVRELAAKLAKASDQVRAAFFRRAYLQKQQNRTTIVNYRHYKGYRTADGSWMQGGVSKTTQIINSDQRQGVRFLRELLEQDFKTIGLQTGILTSEVEADTGRVVLKIDKLVGKELHNRLSDLITDNNSYALERNARGNLTQKYSSKFTDSAKQQLMDIIHQVGVMISFPALNDLLSIYRVTNSSYAGDEKAVAVQLLLNTILARFAGIDPYVKSKEPEDSQEEKLLSDYELNNPFKKDISAIHTIARFEYPYRVQTQSGAYRSGGKSYYPFVRHNYLSEMFADIKSWLNYRLGGDKNIFAKLRHDSFAKHSMYLKRLSDPIQFPEFAKIFNLRYELGARNRSFDGEDKLLQDMTEREHQITKLVDFQNSGNRAAVMHYDTLSDKITKPVIDVLRQDVSYDVSNSTIEKGNILLDDFTMDTLFRYFLAEYERIQHVTRQNLAYNHAQEDKFQLIKGYHDVGNKEGMGKYFNIYYFFNKASLDADNPTLASQLYNQDGSLRPITEELTTAIKKGINYHLNKIFKKTKDDFTELRLFDVSFKNKRNKLDPKVQDLVDTNYLLKIKVKLGLENIKGISKGHFYKLTTDQLNRIVDYAIVDYVVNYVIFSNEMLMFTGDPAQAGKLADKTIVDRIMEDYKGDSKLVNKYITIANVESTFVNIGKRNAAFLGSGEKGKFLKAEYNVSIANDVSIDSPQFEQYRTLFKGNENTVEKAYKSGDLTDAQELTTVEEHLHTMLAFGQITKDQYKKALALYDQEHFHQLFPGERMIISGQDRIESQTIVLQPMKPVQRTYNIDERLHISKQYYIKTSSYPIIPSMVQGPLLDLVNDMKRENVNRVAFVSGVKQGVAGARDLFDKDGNYNDDFLKNNVSALNRDGFRIQLEVPFEEGKSEIREGTQMSKLLFVDVPEELIVRFNGKDAPVSELKKLYNQYHKAIVDVKTEELLKDLGAERDESGQPVIRDLRKLAKILQEEGLDRGYSINSLLGLDLNERGEFKIPLTFLPNTGQIQPVLTAIVSNRIARLKMPGKSYVQGSEVILKAGQKIKVKDVIEDEDRRRIVWTRPEYTGIQKLKYLRVENNEVQPAQIVLPFYFIGNDGKRIDLREYTEVVDGKMLLSSSQVDEELYQHNGFRIPYQGHNSGMWFEVVGFLPYEVGDLVIVPGEIAAQMGSDYDVDKLYAYMYNYYFDGKAIRKVESSDPKTLEQYQNALIDIHKAVFTSKELFQPILDPLGFGDVETAIMELGSEEKKDFLGAFDPTYQRDVYFSNRGGQLGVGITANANTSHAIAQTVNLFIKGQGVLFLNENGIAYEDIVDKRDNNRVNKFEESTYTYLENDELKNQNDDTQKSAWRLDKVYTFANDPKTGKPFKISSLISQLLGISVDNAKEQKLGAFGLNKHNFNVALTIIRSGFDLVLTKAFINQPILKEYYNRIGDAEDMYTVDFTPNKREQIVKDIFEKYGKLFGLDSNAIYERSFIKGTRLSDLKVSLEAKEVGGANALQQLEILKAFLHYKNISDGLQGLSSALNMDTKGLPKNVSETISKKDTVRSNIYDNQVFGNAQRLVQESIPGLFSHLPGFFEQLFANPEKPLFAYNSVGYTGAKAAIEDLTGRKIASQDKLDMFHNSIKQFLYTTDKLELYEDIDRTRREILFDYEGNQSLQTRLLDLRAKYPENELLRAINPVISEYVNDPKRLEIPLSTEGDYTEKIKQYWEFMLYNSDNDELSSFGNDLIKYAFLISSQEYGSSNLIKYIPFSSLEQIGFGEELNRINKELFHNEELLSGFVHQFIQHHPDFTIAAREDNFLKDSVVYDTIPVNDVKGGRVITNTIRTNIINRFKLPIYSPDSVSRNVAASLLRADSDGFYTYPEYLSVFIDNKVGKLLYRKVDGADGAPTYLRIDTLGANNVSEYSFGESLGIKRSLFEGNRSSVTFSPPSRATIRFEAFLAAAEDTPIMEQYFPKDGAVTISDLLSKIRGRAEKLYSQEIDSKYSRLYGLLASSIIEQQLSVPVIVNYNHPTRASATIVPGDWSQTRIVFNPRKIFEGSRSGIDIELDGIRTILHEVMHVLTLHKIKDQTFQSTGEYRQLKAVWNEYKRIIRTESDSKQRGIGVSVFDAELFSLLVERYKQYKNTKLKQSEIYSADIKVTVERVLGDEAELLDLLGELGNRLDKLYKEGEIDKSDFNLTDNSERLQRFKDRISSDFRNNIKGSINKYYAYYSLDEFVSEAMTNPVTQELLRKTPSILERFKNAITALISRILNLNTEERTLLDDAIDSIVDVIGEPFRSEEGSSGAQEVVNVEDISAPIEDTRFQHTLERKKKILKLLKLELKGKLSDQRRQTLRDRIELLQSQIGKMEDPDTRTMRTVMNSAVEDTNLVSRLLEGTPTPKDLEYARNLMYGYVQTVNEFEAVSPEDIEQMSLLIATITRIDEDLERAQLAHANEVILSGSGRTISLDGVLMDSKDIKLDTLYGFDTTKNENSIVQAITKLIKRASQERDQVILSFNGRHERLVSELKKYQKAKGIKERDIYEYMIQRYTSGPKKDQRSGLYVSEFTADYYGELKSSKESATKMLKFLARNHAFAIDEGAWKLKQEDIKEYYNNKELQLSEIQIGKGVTVEELRNTLANRAIAAVNPYTMKAVFEKVAQNEDSLTAQDVEYFREFDKRFGWRVAGKQVLNKTPLKKWLDTKYQEIQRMDQKDPRRLFYEHFDKNIKDGRKELADDEVFLPWNYIPERKKDLGLVKNFKQWWTDQVSQKIAQNIHGIDPITDQPLKQIPIFTISGKVRPEDKSYNLDDVLKAFVYETKNKKYMSKIEDDVKVLQNILQRQKVYLTNPDGTPLVINGVTQYKKGASNNYEQAAYRIAAQIYMERQDKEGITGKKMYDEVDKSRMKEIEAEIDELGLSQEEKKSVIVFVNSQKRYSGDDERIEQYVKLAKEYKELKERYKNVTVSKVVNFAKFWTSIKLLGLNLFGGVTEIIQGIGALLIEGASRTAFNTSEGLWGLGKMLSILQSGNEAEREKINRLSKLFKVEGEVVYDMERSFVTTIAFYQYKIAKLFVNNGFLLAMLKAEKIKDKDGRDHSLYEVMSVDEDGIIQLPESFENPFTKFDENGEVSVTEASFRLQQKFREIIKRNRDRESSEDPILLDKSALGRALGQFKASWMFEAFHRRFGRYRADVLHSGKDSKGFYRSVRDLFLTKEQVTNILGEREYRTTWDIMRGIKELWRLSFFVKYGQGGYQGDLSKLDEANIRMFLREMTLISMAFSAIIVLRMALSDDDEDDEEYAQGKILNYLLNQFLRVHRDLTTYLSPSSFASILRNPAPITGTLIDFTRIAGATLDTVFGDPYAYEGTKREYLKIPRRVEEATPLYRQIRNLTNKFERQIDYSRQ